MSRLILIVVLIVAFVLLARHVRSLNPQDLKKFWVRFGFGVLFGLVILLTLTGRLHYIAAIVTALIPFAKKLLPLIRYVPLLRGLYKQAQGSDASSGQTSEVVTSLLKMTLEHDSGNLDGEILQGEFQGRRLADMSTEELERLYGLARSHYTDSIELLEAYLDRRFGDNWRQNAQSDSGAGQESRQSGSQGDMDLSEAYAMLGLEQTADAGQVVQAHRKLMQKLHPDHGGNDYLAAKLNQAKDLLLKHIS